MKTKPSHTLALCLAATLLVIGLYFSTGLFGRKSAYHRRPPLPSAIAAQLAREKGQASLTSQAGRVVQPDGDGSLSRATIMLSSTSTQTDGARTEDDMAHASTAGATTQSNRRQNPAQSLKSSLNPAVGITPNLSTAKQSQVKLPLALIDPDPSLKFTVGQLERLKNLRQSFIDEVGGLNQNPSDPAYLQSWQNAQLKSDQLFKTLYGWKAYDMQLLKAMQEASNYQPE